MPHLGAATQVVTKGISKPEDKVCGAQAMLHSYNKTTQEISVCDSQPQLTASAAQLGCPFLLCQPHATANLWSPSSDLVSTFAKHQSSPQSRGLLVPKPGHHQPLAQLSILYAVTTGLSVTHPQSQEEESGG